MVTEVMFHMVNVTWQQGIAYLALGFVFLASLLLAGYLVVGLFNARSLIRREFAAYFVSPIAYVVLVIFLAVTGFFFSQTLDLLTEDSQKGVEYPMQAMYGSPWFLAILLVIPALLTMRLFAEERSTGTLEVLMTAPLRDWQVVLSKYVACFAFYVFLWLPTLIYLPILLNVEPPVPNVYTAWSIWSVLIFGGVGAVVCAVVLAFLPLGNGGRAVALLLLLAGIAATVVGILKHYSVDTERLIVMPARIDPMPVWTTYLGLALVGAMFLAVGMFISSLVRQPVDSSPHFDSNQHAISGGRSLVVAQP